MRALNLVSLLFFFFVAFCTQRELCEASSHIKQEQEYAEYPPRGWNSYDSFSWTINEEEFLANAEIVSKRLLSHGYEYVVVDYLWYRLKVPGANADSLGFDFIDQWGRMLPDPNRFQSSLDGNGFTELAKKVHAMGLKFGIHVMRGISTQAVNNNTPILDITTGAAYREAGREWRAKDIGLTDRLCGWMHNGFMSVDTKLGAGRAFLKSLYKQYADWGVDFVKNDCVFGDDFDVNEITVVSEELKQFDRRVLYSLSPGTSVTPAMAKEISSLVNMYRVTADDWDTWGDVAAHFNVARDFAAANMIGAPGLKGKSWPDLDMLPLGWLTDPASNEGPHRKCKLTLKEQRAQMTLWSMAKSPLFFGGDLRNLDEQTYGIISQKTLLEINHFSSNNMEFANIYGAVVGSHHRDLSGGRPTETKSDKHTLHLTSCKDHYTKGWVSEVLDQELERICWKYSLGSKYMPPFCLYKRQPLLTLNENILKPNYQGNLHLFASDSMDYCLDGSPKRKLTSQELRRSSFSPCSQEANQMWELTNGTLVNSYSGLCATVKRVNVNQVAGGRAWIATGRNIGLHAFHEDNKISPSLILVYSGGARNFSMGRQYIYLKKDLKKYYTATLRGFSGWMGKALPTVDFTDGLGRHDTGWMFGKSKFISNICSI